MTWDARKEATCIDVAEGDLGASIRTLLYNRCKSGKQ